MSNEERELELMVERFKTIEDRLGAIDNKIDTLHGDTKELLNRIEAAGQDLIGDEGE